MKVHERFGGNQWSKFPSAKNDYDVDRENNNSHLDFLKGIPPGMHNSFFPQGSHLGSSLPDSNSMAALRNGGHVEYESEMLDLSMNSSRNRGEERSYDIGYKPSPNKRMKAEVMSEYHMRNGDATESEIQRSGNTSPSIDEQAENLSISATNSEDGNSVHGSPDKSQYLGKSPYLSSPFHLQKKSPLKSDRWTPSTPLPTVPECRQCGFHFDSFDVLSEHNEAVHSVFTCPHCHKTFTSRSNLERHARLHTGFKPYICAICQKAFSRKDHLSNHSAKHAYKCGNCNKRYADKPNLATHFTYEHDSILTNCCEFCNKGFGNVETYEEHLKTHPQYHAVQKSYFNQQMRPNTTSSTSSSPSPKKYACDSCKFISHERILLIKHRLVHMEGQRRYTCLACTKNYEDPLRYEEHLITNHQGETNIFECTICRQVFQTLEVLRRHEVIHLGEDLNEMMSAILPCPHCEKVFRGIANLQEHMVMHNNQIRKHRCFFCNLGFNTYSELCRHMDELRHYPPDPRMLFGMAAVGAPFADPRKYTEYLAKRNLQKELMAGKPLQSVPASENVNTGNNSMQTQASASIISENNTDDDNNQTLKNDSEESRAENNDSKVEYSGRRQEQEMLEENDIGSDIEVVEPEAPEEHHQSIINNIEHQDINNIDNNNAEDDNSPNPRYDHQQQRDDSVNSYEFVVTENKSKVIEIVPEGDRDCEGNERVDEESQNMHNEVQENKERLGESGEGAKDENEQEQKMSDNEGSNNDKVETAENNIAENNTSEGDQQQQQPQTLVQQKSNSNDRARKRKGPSPEKYVDDGEPVDLSLSEYYPNYENYDHHHHNNNAEHSNGINSEEDSTSPLSTTSSLPALLLQQPNHMMFNSFNNNATSPLSSATSSPGGGSGGGFDPQSLRMTHTRIIDRKPRDGSKTAPAKISFDIPSGPYTCSMCQVSMGDFQSLEQHCFAEHNRCPCMFCPKTFAQKANRDRHICLHTGDKPYACPECGEKFSRGDKLKLHRVRTHNIPTSTNPSTPAIPVPTPFTLKRDATTPGSASWSISHHHSPSANHSDSAESSWALFRDESSSSVVHGAGEWSMIPETTPTY